MAGTGIGYASLQVVPSAKNFGASLRQQIAGPLAAEGKAAGEKAGGLFGGSFAKVAAAGLAVGGAALGAFAVKSADTFSRVGGEVLKLQRYTGLTAEAASRLRFAGQESGIGIDTMTRSLGILSKNLAGKTLDKLGFQFKDIHGKALPLDQDLLQIAKRFQSMPNGAEKTALAMKLFGRAGADLIPFLNKGADGIAALEKQSDKFGQTLSGKDLEAVKASTIAHRQFSAAMEGLQIQIGRYVLPVITDLVKFTTSGLIPAITVVSDLARQYLGPAFSYAFGIIDKVGGRTLAFFIDSLLPGIKLVIARIVEVVTPFAKRLEDGFDRVRQVIDDKLTPAVRDRLMPVLDRLSKFVLGNLGPALAGVGAAGALALGTQFAGLAGSIGGVIQAIAVLPLGIGLAIAAVAALAAGFFYAYKHSAAFREEVQLVIAGVKQAIAVLFEGKFTGGPFAADSPFIVNLFKLREIVITKIIPAFHQIADFVQAHLQQVLIGLGVVILGMISPWVLLGAAIVALYAKSETFRTVVEAVVDFMQTKAGPAIAKFADGVADTFTSLVGFVRDRWASISEAVLHVVNVIRDVITITINVVSALWRAWGDDLTHFTEAFFGHIQSTIENTLTVVRGIIDVVLALINGDWGKAWDGVKEILAGVWSEMGNIVSLGIDTMKLIIGGVLSTIAQVWNGIWSGIGGTVRQVFAAVILTVQGGVDTVVGVVTGLGSRIGAVASTIFDPIVKAAKAMADWVLKQLDRFLGPLEKAANVIGGVLGTAGKIAGGIASHIPGFASGGVMPGPLGVHSLAWVAGGETILPTHEPQWQMARPGAAHYASRAAPTKAGDVINLNVTQYPGEDQVSAGMRELRWHQMLKTELAVR